MKTARQFAIRDIAKHLREEEKKRGFRSVFIVAAGSLCTQENRRLNELLGVMGNKTDVGVYWYKDNNKWRAQIWAFGRRVHLGYFTHKQDALDKYQKALEKIENYNGDAKQFRNILTL